MYLATMTFEEAFPAIEDIRIEYREYDSAGHPSYNRPSVSTKENIFLEIGCSNRVCHEGGFALLPIIRKMYPMKETTFQRTITCRGYEGSKKVGRRCWHYLELSITVRYKEAASQ